jgi:hypothetical protein
MEVVEQRNIESHGNRFITGDPQVQPRDTVISHEWAKRYKTPLVEKVSFRRGDSRQLLIICFHHVSPVEVVVAPRQRDFAGEAGANS